MATVNVGLIGVGTVGGGVVRLLRRNSRMIGERTGVDLRLVHVADRGIEEASLADLGLGGCRRSVRPEAVVDDPGVDVVVELIGGIEPARTLLLAALDRGKHVVTANKALLAHHGSELIARALQRRVELAFEASVAGTIPILRALREGLAADRILEVTGILNGTTNYVLTRMDEEGLGLTEALREAQERGFAEADPSLDVDGSDAAHKLAILARLAFGISPSPGELHVAGIGGVTREEVACARREGAAIKLVASARRGARGLDLRVGPERLPRSHPLASVRLEQNAVLVRGEASGETLYCGRGAGSLPTATAVLGDVIDLGRRGLPMPSSLRAAS